MNPATGITVSIKTPLTAL